MKSKSNTLSPSPLDSHLGFWLRFVSNHVSARFQRQLAAKDVSVTEWVALRTLWEGGETTQAQLIQALGMTKGAISKLVSRLEEKSLAQRRSLSGNVRDQTIVLTASGKAMVPRLAVLADANDEHFFGHLSAQQRHSLMSLMRDLVRHHKLKDIPIS